MDISTNMGLNTTDSHFSGWAKGPTICGNLTAVLDHKDFVRPAQAAASENGTISSVDQPPEQGRFPSYSTQLH